MSKQEEKGPVLEEAMRHYFLKQGFFAVRALPVIIENETVTDIDLLLFGKPNPFLRHRINVDIRNRKRPQAHERLIWAKGVQSLMGFDHCILVTTDARPSLGRIAKGNHVSIITKQLVMPIIEEYSKDSVRLTEDEFVDQMKLASEKDSDSQTPFSVYTSARAIVVNRFTSDSMNQMLETVRDSFNFYLTADTWERSVRLLYLSSAFFLLIVDFWLKDHISATTPELTASLTEVIRYGSSGKRQSELLLSRVDRLLSIIKPVDQPDLFSDLRQVQQQQWNAVPAEIVADFLGSESTVFSLFERAVLLEQSAYAKDIVPIASLPADIKAVVYMLADYCKIDRKLL
ncbi:MAG: hypothetical protein F9K24_13695 [Leptonema illini]|uniref:Uncharacterized protein n=1 Tax=Leptonema illini TaxID=183 RepID=A0A833GZT1_9LEPT|nr:MAG: hypothetical protein F9K24_13695 [Leptonema illini]